MEENKRKRLNLEIPKEEKDGLTMVSIAISGIFALIFFAQLLRWYFVTN